jgi:hypothetical protein
MDQLSESKIEAALHVIAWEYQLHQHPPSEEEIALLKSCVSHEAAASLDVCGLACLVIQQLLSKREQHRAEHGG